MPQLDPTWFASQLFWLAIGVVFLYVVLSRFVLPPLMSVLDVRQATRMSDLERAQALKSEAESAKTEYEQALSDARLRAQQLFADAEAKAKQASEKALSELNRASAEQLAQAEKRISAKKAELLAELEPAAADLTAMAIEKLMKRRPDESRVKSLIHDLSRV